MQDAHGCLRTSRSKTWWRSMESGAIEGVPTVEGVQDLVEEALIDAGFVPDGQGLHPLPRRAQPRPRREQPTHPDAQGHHLLQGASDSDMKRENANIDGDTAMGTMLKYGSEGGQAVLRDVRARPGASPRAHREGDIHIHDMDFYTLTTTCCQIDLLKLFHGGFSTGHGVLREPNDIASYAALACIAIQSNQNDQHGGQSIANFDYGMAEGVTQDLSPSCTGSNLARGARRCWATRRTSARSCKTVMATARGGDGPRRQPADDWTKATALLSAESAASRRLGETACGQGPGLRAQARREGDRPGHLPGHGGARSTT